jgi:hypothetical protein
MALTYDQLYRLFCPDVDWHTARLKAITDDQKAEWHLQFNEYCKAVERAAKEEIMAYTLMIQGEIDRNKALRG